MKLAWLTDIHLNFLDTHARIDFYQEVIKTKSNAVLISGDIAEAPSVSELLKEMANHIKKPIYFVLGNHDYYKGQVEQVRNAMYSLTQTDNLLRWLPAAGPQELEKGIILLGQDGWADGHFGDYHQSQVSLNDSRLIADLFQQKILGKDKLLKKMQELADADASLLHMNLDQAIKKYQPEKIIVLTHVPPFKEACLYEGKISNDDYLPYFSSKIMGDVLKQVAEKNQAVEFLVLCGHTHSEASYKSLDNLTIKVGKAEYFRPIIQNLPISLNNKLLILEYQRLA